MEKFRTNVLVTIYLKIMQMGNTALTEIVCYSCFLGVVFQMLVSLYALSIFQIEPFGNTVFLLEKIPYNTLVYNIIIIFSLLLKGILFLGILLFSKISNTLIKKSILFLINLSDQVVFLTDAFMMGHMINHDYRQMILAGVNMLGSFLLKIVNQVIYSNYAFIYSYPLKKMPTFFYTIIIAVLQAFFVIFQLNMRANIYTTLFFITASFQTLVLVKFFYDVPYLNSNVLSLRQILFNNWVCFAITEAGNLLFKIVSDNAVVFYMVLFVFGIILNITCMTYIKQKRLLIDIETSESWTDINTKIHYSYQFIENDNLDKISVISKEHFQKCKNLDCKCRWKELKSPIDFRHNIFSSKSDLFSLKVFLQYYILVLCQNFKTRFFEVAQAWVVYISALSMLNLYPKLMYYSTFFSTFFSSGVGLSEKSIVCFLKKQIIQFIEQKNNKNSVLQIQKIKKVDELQNNLKLHIQKIVDIKEKIWMAFLESPVEQEIVEELLNSELDQRQLILKVYNSIIQIPHKKLSLWRIMTAYCRNVIQDHQLERVIRKNISKQDLITKNVESIDQKEGLYPRKIQEFLNLSDNYCLIKISMGEKTLGQIQWHNQNLSKMLGHSKPKMFMGESINILIPGIFKQYHSNVLKEWYQYPRSHKLNRMTQTYIQTNIRQFQSVFLYMKILATEDGYGVFSIFSQNTYERLIILNQNSEEVTNSNFIKEKLKAILHHDQPILDLLSKDYENIRNMQSSKYQQSLLKFYIPEDYEQYFKRYQSQLSVLDFKHSKEKYLIQKQNIIQRIASEIESTTEVQLIQMEVLVKSIKITYKNVTSSYVIVKQSIDQESYNDENQKLMKKKEFQNNTTMHLESSPNFQGNLTKTTQKKQIFFQQSESSVSNNKNSNNRDFVKKLQNVDLLWFKKIFYVCLLVYFVCQIGRIIQLFYFYRNFRELLIADNAVSNFITISQTIYDNSLLNAYSFTANGSSVNFNKSDSFILLIQQNYKKLGKSLYYQSSQASNLWMKQFSVKTIQWFSNVDNIFEFPIFVWFEAWSKLGLMSAVKSPESWYYTIFLQNNYNHLVESSHNFLKFYLQSAKTLTSVLKYLNVFFLFMNAFVVSVILYSYNKYLNRKQKSKYNIIRIFTQIDQPSIKSYINQCRQYQEDASHVSVEQVQQENENKYLNRKVFINKSKIPQFYKVYMLVVAAILILDIFGTAYTAIKANCLQQNYESSNRIGQSFIYQLESLTQLKEVAMGIRSYSNQSSLQMVNQDDYSQFKDHTIQLFQIFNDKHTSNQINQMYHLLFDDLCVALSQSLSPKLNDICQNQFELKVVKSGAMAFSHYIVDVISQNTEKMLTEIGNQEKVTLPWIVSNTSLIDGSLSLTYRSLIVQKIQKQIQIIVLYQQDLLRSNTLMIVISAICILLVFLFLWYFFMKMQNRQWKYIYGSLLIVPQKQLIKSSAVTKMVAQLKDKSLK